MIQPWNNHDLLRSGACWRDCVINEYLCYTIYENVFLEFETTAVFLLQLEMYSATSFLSDALFLDKITNPNSQESGDNTWLAALFFETAQALRQGRLEIPRNIYEASLSTHATHPCAA